MGTGRLNVWVSDVADPCGTFNGSGRMTIFDCEGILQWPCGRFLAPNGQWQPVPNGIYRNLPFRCGHLEVELPPSCYWVIAGSVSPAPGFIHLNYTTHVGIVQVGCNETACVKLYNPTLRLCWNWFLAGLRILSTAHPQAGIDPEEVEKLQNIVEEKFLQGVRTFPIERVIARGFEDLAELAGRDLHQCQDKDKDNDQTS